jgi:hypothetical protein
MRFLLIISLKCSSGMDGFNLRSISFAFTRVLRWEDIVRKRLGKTF